MQSLLVDGQYFYCMNKRILWSRHLLILIFWKGLVEKFLLFLWLLLEHFKLIVLRHIEQFFLEVLCHSAFRIRNQSQLYGYCFSFNMYTRYNTVHETGQFCLWNRVIVVHKITTVESGRMQNKSMCTSFLRHSLSVPCLLPTLVEGLTATFSGLCRPSPSPGDVYWQCTIT